jgi:UPF0716 protein FxsA
VLVLLALLLWPIAELIAIVVVAEQIGVWWTLLLLALGLPVGWWMMRSQGRGVMRRLSTAITERRPPAREVLDGALVLLGGFLVIVPGFISDVFGLLLILPPTRAVARRLLAPRLRSRVVVRAVGFGAPRRDYDVDSTARDVRPPKLNA